ncbi:MAG TPA: hypothetical protein VGK10_12580 [Prolixibacteraceae bacterium]|jgi:hypothetical protein
MKKVMILGAAIMAFSFVTPQVAKAMKLQNQTAIVQDKDAQYKEIKVEELPAAVTKSISNAYTGYKIDKAFLGADDTYKVNVAMGDLKYQLFYDAKGELIKVEDAAAKGMEPAKGLEEPVPSKGMEPENKSQTPVNKSQTPVNKSEYPTNQGEKVPVK